MKVLTLMILLLNISCGSDNGTSSESSASNMKSAAQIQKRSETAKRLLSTIADNENFLYICDEVSELKSNRSKQTQSKLYTYKIEKCGILNLGIFCQNNLVIKERTVVDTKSVKVQEWELPIKRNQRILEDDFKFLTSDIDLKNGMTFYNREKGTEVIVPLQTDLSRNNYERYCEGRI